MAKKVTSTTKTVCATKVKTTAKLSRGGQEPASTRILKAIASLVALGQEAPDRERVQALAAMPNKASFATTLLNMKKKVLITYTTTTVSLTEKGLEVVGPEAATVPATNEAMQAKLKETIKVKTAHKLFDVLTNGRAYSRQELAEKLGVENNNSFGTYVSALSKVVVRENGKIRLQDIAFPCGRPCDAI